MDDTVGGLWERLEKLETERDELQAKLNIAVEALRKIELRKHTEYFGVEFDVYQIVIKALGKLEE